MLGVVADDGRRGRRARPARRVALLRRAGRLAGALLLVLGPWIWQLARSARERIRLEERAEVAARIHDSVLQTLALIQRHADDPQRVPRSRAARSASSAAGSTAAASAPPSRSSTRSRTPRPTSRSCTACASSSRAPATAARRVARAARARRARGDDERRQVLRRRRDRRLRRGGRRRRSPCSCATAASASTARRCAADRRGHRRVDRGADARAPAARPIVTSSPGDGHRGRADDAEGRA